MSRFGDVCHLLAESGVYTHWSLSKIGEMFGYPMSLNQCFVFYRDKNAVGVITYAYVSDDSLEELLSGKRIICKDDWQSGKNLFVPDFVAPFGDVKVIAREFHKFVKDTHGKGFQCNWYRTVAKRNGYASTR